MSVVACRDGRILLLGIVNWAQSALIAAVRAECQRLYDRLTPSPQLAPDGSKRT